MNRVVLTTNGGFCIPRRVWYAHVAFHLPLRHIIM